ncbi:NAD-P-binding protein [Dichomitus squalens]|uniref:NAD-P-binding protein n=1 Tax=Dichomitus squalens TaxID=114155 RepID=A0A4V2K6H7_9APHY|nr:NAD-P-binding protein [Dichomitus squalens]
MSSEKPLVLVLGATGKTGQSIVRGLLRSEEFRIAALIRPSSLSKPATEQLRTSGIDIRAGDITDDYESLKKTLQGVDTLSSSVFALLIEQQKDIFRAAKELGVKRVVPCDFGSPGARGVRVLHDMKLAMRDFAKDLGVPYTFIDVGWWMQYYLPLPLRSTIPEAKKQKNWQIYGPGDKPILVTNVEHVGEYVAQIITDKRTAREIGERVSGDSDALEAKRVHLNPEDITRWTAEGRAHVGARIRSLEDYSKHLQYDYHYSMHVLHESTLENAKRLGYLDPH